ncbi:hypothetical protein VT91_09420 [Clostridium sporogenes]|uniref:hypothetical protein n=1 Tax=Clostridium botulinum TaxID=1491 RepID=UPI00072B5CAE|nr:hypothetical protein [Clostridium botulinum]KRU29328.1 hypothetical protein WG71_15710 [Clostridium sporogenes]KRU33416.1 hypothetical protein VT91_09420 [Clostridium sporogenes]KRU33952.1 hypothetical protein VT28_05080 [Clostridium sporogenes]KRU43400.1 hypothetical protein VT95_16650 [Clostridium sporogenes]MBZ1331011.1 hypothetical protein [Clostridium botulinum]
MNLSKEEFKNNILALQAKRKRKREIEYIAAMRESFNRCAKKSRGNKVRVRGQI